MKHCDIAIIGRVQGVYFRGRAKEKADELGLAGAVWNEPDGSVRAEIEGEESAIEAFIAWCKDDPGIADVGRVDVEERIMKGLHGFEIRV